MILHCERKETKAITASDFEELRFTAGKFSCEVKKGDGGWGRGLALKIIFPSVKRNGFFLALLINEVAENGSFLRIDLLFKSSSGVKTNLFLPSDISSEYMLCSPDVSQSGKVQRSIFSPLPTVLQSRMLK